MADTPLLNLFSGVFRGSGWSNLTKPVVVLDGQAEEWRKDRFFSGSFAYIVGANENNFEELCGALSARVVVFYEMRVSALSSLQEISGLEHLAINWNNKVTDLSPLSYLSCLKTLSLIDTPKATDISPLSTLQELCAFEFSGAPTLSNKNTAKSLEPLVALTRLEELRLTNLKVEEDGLRPIAKCRGLKRLSVANTFDTEDYAFLAAKMPNTVCRHFNATVQVQGDAIKRGIDTMVVGRRKPFLSSREDAGRIAVYEAAFAKLKAKHSV
ncbi:leucine-rich repeat domain-containing protein [Brucella pituitosa]|uniref:Leucine-rich repeat domain-containing protein n=1 Tax=Brucella pituitosa TaxID=571256 RepID=A0A643EV75_9HYPH|nr:leucine-rich repeat domain-containing protein [Brucella pituitosa]KAB0564623.1 leucine-rich repeat domain-containing protein [Brucella pituitosa]